MDIMKLSTISWNCQNDQAQDITILKSQFIIIKKDRTYESAQDANFSKD